MRCAGVLAVSRLPAACPVSPPPPGTARTAGSTPPPPRPRRCCPGARRVNRYILYHGEGLYQGSHLDVVLVPGLVPEQQGGHAGEEAAEDAAEEAGLVEGLGVPVQCPRHYRGGARV